VSYVLSTRRLSVVKDKNFSQVYRGLKIFDDYMESSLAAEHDEIFATVEGTDFKQGVAPHDANKLKSLDWDWDASFACWKHFV
jgi:hypothetical protein